jgi:hypothetical protein
MAEKKYHKGWLYERDGVKFSPYTLKEGIIDRNGTKWAESVDSSINAANEAIIALAETTIPNLEGQIAGAHDRATLLEQRTQYMDATASEVFYVVDENGNIAL